MIVLSLAIWWAHKYFAFGLICAFGGCSNRVTIRAIFQGGVTFCRFYFGMLPTKSFNRLINHCPLPCPWTPPPPSKQMEKIRQQDDIYFYHVYKKKWILNTDFYVIRQKQENWEIFTNRMWRSSLPSLAQIVERDRDLKWEKTLHIGVFLSSFVDSITLNVKHLKWTYSRMTPTFSWNKSINN